MRNISFSMTEAAFLAGEKTVTRRLGWLNLKAGAKLRAVDRVMGFKKGEKPRTLGIIEVKSVRREPIRLISALDCRLEGYPDLTPADFVALFCKAMRCTPDTPVTRIEFWVLSYASQTTEKPNPTTPEKPLTAFHPLADLFPKMTKAEFKALKESILQEGQQEPITLITVDGKDLVLDGRHRWRACMEIGIEPKTRRFEDLPAAPSPLAWVASSNLHRRHLTAPQRAIAAAKIRARWLTLEKQHRKQQDGARDENGKFAISAPSRADLAATLNTSERSIQSANTVLTRGTPELQEQLEQGRIATNTAERIARLPAPEQNPIVRSIAAAPDAQTARKVARDALKPAVDLPAVARALDPDATLTDMEEGLRALDPSTSDDSTEDPGPTQNATPITVPRWVIAAFVDALEGSEEGAQWAQSEGLGPALTEAKRAIR